MIKYKIDVLEALKNKGYSTYKIRKDKILNNTQAQKLRDNEPITFDVLDKLCILLGCQPGDLLEFIPDNTNE